MDKVKFWSRKYEGNIDRLVAICYRYVGERQTAEDLAHEAFLKAIERADTCRVMDSFDAWLTRITVNRCISYLRTRPETVSLEKELTADTAAILVNTPNNPSGTVYCEETIKKLAAILNEKQREFGHDIFIISDEPYREIVFDGKQTPYISNFYDNTLSCYSFSKSLSLPGERIGYVAANPRCTDSDLIVPICTQISRGIGHNCPASSIQLGIAEVLDETSDLSVYETNMNLLYDALTDIGFECRRPGGTFYMFPKALEEDATAFCLKAKEYDLILVPSDSFGCEGHFRIAYCTDTEKVKRSLDVFRRFASEVYGM